MKSWWYILILPVLVYLVGCFSMIESGLGKVDGGSGNVQMSTMALDAVTLPAQIVFFTGLALDYGFASVFTESGRRKWAAEHGATASFVVSVLDEEGNAISNAIVKASFFIQNTPASVSLMTTDGLGQCHLIGATSRCVHFDVFNEHYYPSHSDFNFILCGKGKHNVMWGSWQPEKIPIVVKLRNAESPNAAKAPFRPSRIIPKLNEWLEYDLTENDFLVPDGEGKSSDVEIKLNWKGEPGSRMSLDMRFNDPDAGGYIATKAQYSDFKGVYQANQFGTYRRFIRFMHQRDFDSLDSGTEKSNAVVFDGNKILVTRLPCTSEGIHGSKKFRYFALTDLIFCRGNKPSTVSMRMCCVYNPKPGDACLEDFETFNESSELTKRIRDELK